MQACAPCCERLGPDSLKFMNENHTHTHRGHQIGEHGLQCSRLLSRKSCLCDCMKGVPVRCVTAGVAVYVVNANCCAGDTAVVTGMTRALFCCGNPGADIRAGDLPWSLADRRYCRLRYH